MLQWSRQALPEVLRSGKQLEDVMILVTTNMYSQGKIVYIEELRATATNNPFKLQEGTKYKLVSVTSITRFIERD
jgi:hypothetical protein